MPDLYRFSPGRVLWALRQVQLRAQRINKTEIAALATIGMSEAQAALDVRLRFQSNQTSQYPPEAAAADNLVDHGVAAIEGYLEVQARMFQGEARAAAAERLRAALLPDGIAAITKLPYAEQHGAVAALLMRAADAALAADVTALPELGSLLQRLTGFNDQYGAVLGQAAVRTSREELHQAELRCQETLEATAGLIVGHFRLHEPDNTAARNHLLEPIVQ
ncbi:MAG TPA: hypothetical protein VNM90_15235, partial [Haliangium sp.]|nr:hypothetical protein [Haliangium sp.]